MALGVDALFSQMEAMGVFTYLVPWVLLYGIFLGLLGKMEIFEKKINNIVAFALSLLGVYGVVNPMTIGGATYGPLIAYFPILSGITGLYMVALLFIAMIPKLFGKDTVWKDFFDYVKGNNWFAAIVLIGAPIALYAYDIGGFAALASSQGMFNIVIMLIILGIIYWTLGGDDTGGTGTEETVDPNKK